MTQAALLNCFPKGSMKDERRGSWSGNEMGLQRRWMVEEEEVVKPDSDLIYLLAGYCFVFVDNRYIYQVIIMSF